MMINVNDNRWQNGCSSRSYNLKEGNFGVRREEKEKMNTNTPLSRSSRGINVESKSGNFKNLLAEALSLP
uniref:Uncharacterized protein n=1 Tax=Romanomermis culicivorax TaxID=13658 RepID=A0A915JJ13_ROMCU